MGGLPIDVRCACIFHFEGDRLIKETVYFDHATLLAQIGVGAENQHRNTKDARLQ